MQYLGRHTCVSYLSPSDLRHIPYLKESGGRLPPFVIAVGDRRRVTAACEVLRLEDTVWLHEQSECLAGSQARGRVDMVLGNYAGGSCNIPILVVETQMGMPAVEIVLREVVTHCDTLYYGRTPGRRSKAVYLIRAGTAAGIQCSGQDRIALGDALNAQFSMGWAGAVLQSLGGLSFTDQHDLDTFKKAWRGLGFGFTPDEKYPLASMSEEVVGALSVAATQLGIPLHCGGNFSKDSLYAESDELNFKRLALEYGVIGTEMEAVMLALTAAFFRRDGLPVKCGMVSGVVGIIGEDSFSTDAAVHCLAESRSLKIAAEALALLAMSE